MQNLEKLPDFAVKMFKTIFVSRVMSSNPSARIEKLRWPVLIVKLRKGQKYSNILKTIANFNKVLLKFTILKSSNQFIVSRDYPVSLFQDLNSFTGSKIHKLGYIRKFEKKIKFDQKIAKTGVIKILITIPFTLETMQQFIKKTLAEIPMTLVPEN